MELFRLLGSIAIATLVGFSLLYIICGAKIRLHIGVIAALSYGVGLAFISLQMLLAYMGGFGFGLPMFILPWILLFVISMGIYKNKGSGIFKVGREDRPALNIKGPLQYFLVAGISFEVIYAFFRALVKPIESYDAIAIYAIKSKIFYFANAIPLEYFSDLAKLYPHPDYPLNIPLSETFIYLSLGSLNDQLVKIIFPLFFCAILVLLYYSIRSFASRTYALIFTFVLAGIPQFNNYATNAYLEVPTAFYCFAGFLFLLKWLEDNANINALVLSAVMTALAAWTKNEGLLYCVIYAGIVFLSIIFRRGKRSAKDILYVGIYPCIILLVYLPWLVIKARWNIVNDEIDLANINPANLLRQVHKLGTIFYELQKQLFGPKKWNIFWPALMVVIGINFRKIFNKPYIYPFGVIVLALCGYILFYMISYVDVVFFTSKTWSRFLLNFLPIAVYLLALLFKDDVNV